jgi:hypothetical protein
VKKNKKNIFDHITRVLHNTLQSYIIDCYLDNNTTIPPYRLNIAHIILHINFAYMGIIIFCLEY